jgi:nitroreductase
LLICLIGLTLVLKECHREITGPPDPQRRDGPRGPLKSYYAQESVGIAVGLFLGALHRAGLATPPHTPAPMTFLRELCGRPPSDKPFMIMPVGYPHLDATVPDLQRKPLEDIASFE